MDCNRDEALRAKSIAEEKFEKKDFASAKRFALKAKTLYPGLDGISQLLMTFEVYVSAEKKMCGEVDWYAVLNVNPTADDETIRKQYRKLALMLHPDKNKSPGADGAFKLISEAWKLLSDKAKRLMYNQRRGDTVFQQRVHVPPGCPAARTTEVVFQNFKNWTKPVPESGNNCVKVPQKSAPPPSCTKRTNTFWTTCQRCRYYYEYEKKYLNCTLLCVTCKVAFSALETIPPFKMCYDPGSNFQAGSVSVKIAKKRKTKN